MAIRLGSSLGLHPRRDLPVHYLDRLTRWTTRREPTSTTSGREFEAVARRVDAQAVPPTDVNPHGSVALVDARVRCQYGQIIDAYVSPRRDTEAAGRFFASSLGSHGQPPLCALRPATHENHSRNVRVPVHALVRGWMGRPGLVSSIAMTAP